MNDIKTLHVGQLNFLNNPEHFASRLSSLKEELVDKNFDVLCFQEILESKRYELETMLSSLGFISSAYGETVPTRHGDRSGNAIFSKVPHIWYEFLDLSVAGEPRIPAVVAKSNNVSGVPVVIISAHLAWGGAAEPVRLRQATIINDYVSKLVSFQPDTVVILTGDFNAVEQSSTLRYLTGKQENHKQESTYWVDAYELHGEPHQWATSNPASYWGKKTAYSVGIHRPEMIPQRRIDYILSYGWCYGKPGTPLNFDVFGNDLIGNETELSDHYGLSSRILLSV